MFKTLLRTPGAITLKRCPHCGGDVELMDSAETQSNVFGPPAVAVHCTRCRAYGHTVCYDWMEHNFFGFKAIMPTRLEARTIAAAIWNARSPREYQRVIDEIADMLHRNRCFDVPENQTDTLDNEGLTHAHRGKRGEHGNEYQRADRPEQRRDSKCTT